MCAFFSNYVYYFLSSSLAENNCHCCGADLICIVQREKKMFQIFYSAETLYALFPFFRLDFWTFSNQNLNQFCQRFCCSDSFMSCFELKRFETIPLYAFFPNKHNRMEKEKERGNKMCITVSQQKCPWKLSRLLIQCTVKIQREKSEKIITRKWQNLNAERKIVRKK